MMEKGAQKHNFGYFYYEISTCFNKLKLIAYCLTKYHVCENKPSQRIASGLMTYFLQDFI